MSRMWISMMILLLLMPSVLEARRKAILKNNLNILADAPGKKSQLNHLAASCQTSKSLSTTVFRNRCPPLCLEGLHDIPQRGCGLVGDHMRAEGEEHGAPHYVPKLRTRKIATNNSNHAAVVDYEALTLKLFSAHVLRRNIIKVFEGLVCRSPRGVPGVCKEGDDCLVKAPNPPPVSEDEKGRPLCGVLGPGALVCCEAWPSDVINATEETSTPATTEAPRLPVGERSTSYCLENMTFRKQPWWSGEEARLDKRQFVPWWSDEGSRLKKKQFDPWWKNSPEDSLNDIASGVETYIHHREYPHLALLGFLAPDAAEISWHCGGSLVSERFVLTAAHCFADERLGAPVVVRLGERDLSRDEGTERDFGIARSWSHPQEEAGTWYHDLALIRLDTAVKFSPAIQPACLSTRPEIEEEERGLVIAGWGSSARDETSVQVLLKGSGPVHVLPRTKCAGYYRLATHELPHGIHPGMVCAADTEGDANTCQGDSGGPLQLKTQFDAYVIVGVATAGVQFCGDGTPGVYTRVSYYLDWIEDIVWPDKVV